MLLGCNSDSIPSTTTKDSIMTLDEMTQWDTLADSDSFVSNEDALATCECVSLEDAELEENRNIRRFGDGHLIKQSTWFHESETQQIGGGVCELIEDWSDGEDSRYEKN